MRIALFQVASPDEETPEDRRHRVQERLLSIADDVDLIVLPELWAAGYFTFPEYPERAEPLDGPTVAVARSVARQRRCWVHAGSLIEALPGGRMRNTAVLVGPSGQVAHTYSKIHVFGYRSLEAELLEPGRDISVTRTPFGGTTAVTCYDLRFPPLWSRLVDLGAELVVVPAAWPAARREHWRLLTAARAVDNQVFVVGCNASGTHAGVEAGGTSRVVDPWGRTVAEAGDDEEVLVVTIDPGAVAATRSEFPVLNDHLADYASLG